MIRPTNPTAGVEGCMGPTNFSAATTGIPRPTNTDFF